MSVSLPKEYIPKKVSVLGAGRSGIAATQALLGLGSSVFISDTCDTNKLDFILATNGLAHLLHESGEHSEKVLDCDVIILSPGIPSDLPVLCQAREKQIPVWSEMELGYRLCRGTFVAVTGSSGKSTTVSLLGAILSAAGKKNIVAGNIGLPVSKVSLSLDENSVLVAEVSSFQLENIDLFRPRVSAVLNLMKNHLDRYADEREYFSAKMGIARNISRNDTLVLNIKDSRLKSWAGEMREKVDVVPVGIDMRGMNCFWHEKGFMHFRIAEKTEKMFDLRNMKIRGSHNYDNACAAAAMAFSLDISNSDIIKGLCFFSGLPHRLEFIREVDNVRYFNDSKSTTAESIMCAITAFENNVHLIAGGKDKGCDFSMAKDAVSRHVKSVNLIGEAADIIEKEWNGLTEINRAPTLEEALETARKKSREGDVVILSPGCSSFDMFKNYEERGDIFKELVNGIRSGDSAEGE